MTTDMLHAMVPYVIIIALTQTNTHQVVTKQKVIVKMTQGALAQIAANNLS